MELTYHGANCLSIKGKKTRLVFDDNLAELGLKPVAREGDIQLFTSKEHHPAHKKAKFVIDSPGEFEISGVSIQAIAARLNIDEEANKAIIYRVITNNARIAILGNISPELSDQQLEDMGSVDVLVVPVGGHGFTMDGAGAHNIVKDIEPNIVIPVHYADKDIKYQVPQDDLQAATKAMTMEVADQVDSLKLNNIETNEHTKLIALNRQ